MSGTSHATTAPAGVKAPAFSSQRERDRFFRQTYEAHFTYVWHALRRYGVFERELEDAAHDVFVVVHRRIDDFDQERPMKPWLLGIAFRVASDFRRRAHNVRELVRDDIEVADGRRDQIDQVAAKESRELVHRALDTLDTDKRAVFVLHELQGYSMPDIAAIVEAPVNTCYSRLRLAREKFTAAVRRFGRRTPPLGVS